MFADGYESQIVGLKRNHVCLYIGIRVHQVVTWLKVGMNFCRNRVSETCTIHEP
jgi:hypothetical protein